MGLFKKKEKVIVCDMCGKADIEGCGSERNHVEQISGDQPPGCRGISARRLRANTYGFAFGVTHIQR